MNSELLIPILPEILLVILAGIVLVFDMAWKDVDQKRNLGWLSAGGLLVILILTWTVALPGDEPVLIWGGMLRHDWLGLVFKSIAMVGAAITVLLSMDVESLGKKGEYYILLLFSTLGMALMAGSADLIMLFLAIETTSIPLYVLAGFVRGDDKSTEAGFKYLLFGALTSAIMLYGFSLLFGFTGTTNLYAIAAGLAGAGLGNIQVAVTGSALLILVGFGFKVSAVPFHFWAPDVYEGAPTPVTGFLSTASKAAGFAVLLRFMLAVFPGTNAEWIPMLAVLSIATMTFGNIIALTQHNIKRLLAYSSIAHAGYILIGVVAAGRLDGLGGASVVFYLIAYLLTNLAAFGIVSIVSRTVGSDEISAYNGLSRRSTGLSLAMLVAFLSLAGVPPLAGFVAKIWVFAAAVEVGESIGGFNVFYLLAFVGVINAIIGVYYYLIVLKHVYLYTSDDDDKPVTVSRPESLALAVLTIGILLVGTVFASWWGVADVAAAALF